jgi:acetyl-CoA carboxylase carboxyl transferase subunit alpha
MRQRTALRHRWKFNGLMVAGHAPGCGRVRYESRPHRPCCVICATCSAPIAFASFAGADVGTSVTLEFEKPIAELERQIDELKRLAGDQQLDVDQEIAPLQQKLSDLRVEIYKNLTPWQRVQVARSPKRPFTLDYIQLAFTDFIELHGDRAFREDAAIVGGWARLDGETVMVIGQQRGRDTKEILKRNFGMPHPEGYRKALRLMKLAEKFHVPVITFIDTMGAWAGLGAEERGQSEAIARNLFEMSRLQVPIIATVIGEGGSGGALALGVADRTNMLENAVYSVITVEGCAAILWKDGKSQEMREKAASALRITAQDLLELRVIDEIIPEPTGGAHSNHEATAQAVKETLVRQLEDLRRYKPDKLVRRRRDKFLRMGQFLE